MRVSDSGLGCGPGGSGFHGWPFCNGDVVPGVDLNSIVEYTHRALAGAVGLMILALVVLAWRRHRQFLGVTVALFVLVLAQAVLGGATVEENLEEALVAAHLGLAMLLLGGLLTCGAARRRASRARRGAAARRWPWRPRLRSSARSSRAATWPGRRTTAGPTTSSATVPTTPAARSSPPATATSCRSGRRAWSTST